MIHLTATGVSYTKLAYRNISLFRVKQIKAIHYMLKFWQIGIKAFLRKELWIDEKCNNHKDDRKLILDTA